MDSGSESDYDAIVDLVSQICETPISLVTLISEDRQWFKAKTGLQLQETPRDLAFCSFTILDDELLEVEDAWLDERFVGHPLVDGDPNIRFYAGVPLRAPSGHRLGALCVIDHKPRTLTHLQRSALKTLSEQVMRLFELRRKNKELVSLQKIQNRLMSIIGHDLRTPIASIQALLELCQDYDLTMEEFKSLLPDIRKNTDSTSELMINLLDWTQSQMNGLVVHREVLDIHELAAQIIEDNRNAFSEKSNRVVSELLPGATYRADRRIVEFLFRNLLLNANKFTDSGTIRISLDGEWISISDTGIGIPPAVISNLFSWEIRTSSLGTNSERGSGLGLPMCNEFIQAHGGDIRVESTPGVGTTVSFRLR